MSGFFQGFTRKNHRTRGKRQSSRSRAIERRHGPLGMRHLQLEPLEERRLLADTTVPLADLTVDDVLTAGDTSWVLSVEYTDDVAVKASTIDNSDVRVICLEKAYNQLATRVSVTPATDATSLTVVYRINARGGTWDVADNGTYTVTMQAGQVTDTSNNPVDAGELGTFEVDITDDVEPTAILTAEDITTGSTDPHTFTVKYTDDTAVKGSTIGNGDVRVTAPNGYDELATWVKTDVSGDGTTRTATYKIPTRDGAWDSTDNETYTVWMETDEVTDTSDNPVADDELDTFEVDIGEPLELSITLLTFSETAGDRAATGTVTLPGGVDATEDIDVTLTSDSDRVEFEDDVVTILAGSSSATFYINAVDDSIYNGVGADLAAKITASADDYSLGTAALTVADDDLPRLTVTFDHSSVWEIAGAHAITGTVTRQGPTTNSVDVTLSSEDVGEALLEFGAQIGGTITVTIDATDSSVDFYVNPVNDNVPDSDQTVIIAATGLGYARGEAELTVLNAQITPTMAIILDAPGVFEGDPMTATIILSQAAPVGGLTVYLSSDDTSEATVPAVVFIRAGETSPDDKFTITGVKDADVDGPQDVTITAVAADYGTATAELAVNDTTKTMSVTFTPANVLEGGVTMGTVTLLENTLTDLIVYLESSDPAEATVPASVTIFAGSKTGNFTVMGVQDGTVDGNQGVTITATPSSVDYAAAEGDLSVIDRTKTLTVTFDAPSVLEGGEVQGTVTLLQNTLSDLIVYLDSSDPAEATVPASVTILANTDHAHFTLRGVQDGMLDGSQSVTVSATPSSLDYASAEADINVLDKTKAITVTINPSAVTEGGTVTGRITLSEPAAANLTVYLTSSDTAEATVPATVFIRAGQTSPDVDFVITGVKDGLLDGSQNVTITATAADYVDGTAGLVVDDTTKTLMVTFDAPSVLEGGEVQGTVTLLQNTLSDLIVYLDSSDPAEATVPASVTILANTDHAHFTLRGVQDGVLDGSQSVTVSATPSSLDYASAEADINVLDKTKAITVTINASSVTEGGTVTGRITLSEPAPAGGLTVYLTSSDTAEATVPATVFIRAGQTSPDVDFTITGVRDGLLDGSQNVTITATAADHVDGTAGLTVNDATKSLTVTFAAPSVSEGGEVQGTVTLLENTLSNLIVYLESSDPAEATVPASVTIWAGENHAHFTLRGVQDGVLDGSQSVTVSATPSSLDYASAEADLNVLDKTKAITVTINASSVTEGGTVTGRITLSEPAPAGGLTVYLTSSDTAEATVPATVFIRAGQTSPDVDFVITGVRDGLLDGSQNVTITATAADYVDGAAGLTVNDATKAMTVTFSAPSVAEGGEVTGYVTLLENTLSDLIVYLVSSDPAEGSVDASVTIFAGSNTGQFKVRGVLDGMIDGNQSVSIMATPASLDYASAEADINVLDKTKVITVTIDKSSINENGTAEGTITLSEPADGDLTVYLTSSDPAEATVQATVTVWDGNTTAKFTITGIKDGQLDGSQNVTITATAADHVDGAASLTVNDVTKTLTITFDASSVSEGGEVQGYVTLLQNATENLTIYLESSDPAQATVDASVTILAGSNQGLFKVRGVQDGVVDGNQTVTFTATPSSLDYAPAEADLNVIDATRTITLTITPSSILEGAEAEGQITLSQAPTTDLIIYLTSSDTAEATVPATVTVYGGNKIAKFKIKGMQDSVVDGAQSVTIIASAADHADGTANLTVNDATKTITLTIDRSSVLEGGTAKGRITLSQAAPTGGLTVYLSSDNPQEATVPATVFIRAGQTSPDQDFTITGVQDGVVDGAQSVTITATAADYSDGTAGLTVNDATKTITITIDKSSIDESGTATGTITLSHGAPAGGVTIYLSSSDTAEALTNWASQHIDVGQTTAKFTITGVRDYVTDGDQEVTFTATALDYMSGTSPALTVTDVDVAKTLSLTIHQGNVMEGQTVDATVTRTGPLDQELWVTLNTSDVSEATVPSTVKIAKNASSATFKVTATVDHFPDGGQDVSISATASGYASDDATIEVLDADQPWTLTVEIDPNLFPENRTDAVTGTVTRLAAPTDADLVVYLTSADPTEATVPTSVTIKKGESSAKFVITPVLDATADGTQSVEITASAPSFTAGTATAEVLDADSIATLSITDVEVDENDGQDGFVFRVTLSRPALGDVTVHYSTVDGTATAGSDYKAKSGSLTIPMGSTSTRSSKIVVPVYGDTTPEGNETFYVRLSNPLGATLARVQATGTIRNDDGGGAAGNPGVAGVGSVADTIGLFASASSSFYLRDSNSAGYADLAFGYGPAGASWINIAGDWNGDGVDTIGLYNPATSTFYLKNSNQGGYADVTFAYGPAGGGWTPIAGDWNGDGIDTIGLYNPATSIFYLRNSNSAGFANAAFAYGPAGGGWQPVVGDWNGDTVDTIGLYNPATSVFYLKNSNSGGYADISAGYGQANTRWTPLAGDWNDDGADGLGLYDPISSIFHLRNSASTGTDDASFAYGPAGGGWKPLVGDWDGSSSAALRAADGATAGGPSAAPLTASALQPLVSEAIARWTATGLSGDSLSAIAQVQVVVTDLPGALLGRADGNTLYIDRDAAGHGWFIDSTPTRDEEFSSAGRAVDPRALDRMDLLTVVQHELGHVLGRSDLDASLDDLMSGLLTTGSRRNAGAAVDALFAAGGQ